MDYHNTHILPPDVYEIEIKDVEKFYERLKDIKVDLEYILDYEID